MALLIIRRPGWPEEHVTINGPTQRLKSEHLQATIEEVRQAAEEVSKALA